MLKKMKRKQREEEEEDKENWRSRIDDLDCNKVSKLEDAHPWRNLQLILSLQNKDIDVERKVELALDYAKSRGNKKIDGGSQVLETVSMSRTIPVLNNWVQSILISSEKKTTASCLDFRCWTILKFCLEESTRQNAQLSFSRDILRVIRSAVSDFFNRLNVVSMNSKGLGLNKEELEPYHIFLDCISLLFSSHGGVSNANLDLWILAVDAVVELVHKIFSDKLDGSDTGIFVFHLSYLVLDPFVNFLRVHPTKKKGFQDFIDRLLEPLLHLIDVLHLHNQGQTNKWFQKLLNLFENVLAQGLFHPVHIDGFLSLQTMSKYKMLDNLKPAKSKAVIKSYHRHLFDKFENIVDGKQALALGGIGQLFCVYINCVKKQKGLLNCQGGLEHMVDDFASSVLKITSSNKEACVLNTETRKSLLDFFVQILDPLLLQINAYVQADLVVGPVLMDVHCILQSANRMLVNIVHEKLYMQMEDKSEGAFVNFLKVYYDLVISFSAKICQLWQSMFHANQEAHLEILNLIAKELVVTVQYLLEIEYMIVGDDQENVWLMMFSFGALNLSVTHSTNQFLISEIVHFGCQLLKVYSELRQVNTSIFAMCKAVRDLASSARDGETGYLKFKSMPSPNFNSYAKLLRMVLCSVELRLSICKAIKSIPEGQASGFIHQLSVDASEAMDWIKNAEAQTLEVSTHGILCFNLQLELMGRGLSEVYSLVLDTMTVTIGNSSLVGVAVENLMTMMHPCMTSLVGLRQNDFCDFLLLVTGKIFRKRAQDKNENNLLCSAWIFVFFFRLYMSCRSLYHQAISLVPPNASRKMSEAMGDSCIAYSGKDWLERTDWTNKGYFFWISQCSAPLLTILQTVSHVYLPNADEYCSPLKYIMNVMAMQRLVDLNKMIKSYEYMIQRNDQLTEDDSLPLHHKKSKKWRGLVSSLKQEAMDLTSFIMKYLSLAAVGKLFINISSETCHNNISLQAFYKDGSWDFSVGALSEKSLPLALWSIICHSIDIWCDHASKTNLKLYLSLLIKSSFLCLSGCLDDSERLTICKSNQKEVTAQLISLELLSDTVLYERKFVRRLMAKTFCWTMKKLVHPLFYPLSRIDLKSPVDWTVALSVVENLLARSDGKHDDLDVESLPYSSNNRPVGCCKDQELIASTNIDVAACRSMLNFLCWMPKGFLGYKSLSTYAICLLNLERLVVGCFSNCHHDHYELLRLFISCRRSLKNILMASCDDKMDISPHSLTCMFSETFFPVLWLMKSLSKVIRLQHTVFKGITGLTDMTLLVDHTSYIFVTLSKVQSAHAIQLLIDAEMAGEKSPNSVFTYENSDIVSCLDSCEILNAWKNVVVIAETLSKQGENGLCTLKEAIGDEHMEVFRSVQKMENLTSTISCFQGFLWGLSSALDQVDLRSCNPLKKLARCNFEPMCKVKICTNTFVELLNNLLDLFLENTQVLERSSNSPTLSTSDHSEEQKKYGTERNYSVSPHTDDDVGKSVRKKASQLEKGSMNNILNNIDLLEPHHLKKHLLLGFLRGEYLEAAFCLRQIFIAVAAILRLNLQINCASLPRRLVPILISISQELLLEFGNKFEAQEPIWFVWIDGVVKFLEQLGNYFPLSNPSLSQNIYIKLIDLHFRAIGKCISLQGKSATLASHETGLGIQTLSGCMESSVSALSQKLYWLETLKARLRMSFKVFVQKAPELHILSLVQAIERALVGVQESCLSKYDISFGSVSGGKVSSIVAASVDCLDFVLEFIKGRKCSNVVKQHIRSFVSCLFNIILHLNDPRMFFGNVPLDGADANIEPDSGSIVLMCVELLTRVSAKQALFQMDSCHIGQSLQVSAALFQNFLKLKNSAVPADFSSPLCFNDKVIDHLGGNFCLIDRQFSLRLYAACCRLLCTILKHHKRESQRCIALLEDSISALLYCLEMVANNGYFIWEVQDGVKCACFLRRVYEEIRQQKDVYGQHSFLLLSNYIWIFCGFGPLKTGIRREIDEALRPGVYALIDSCTADDLQHLHTVFGEGPCRSTLATLKHDYKQNFQFEGKV